jgi:hypothetical protein
MMGAPKWPDKMMGAPKWPPIAPSARDAPGNPGHPSITRPLSGPEMAPITPSAGDAPGTPRSPASFGDARLIF